MHCLALAALMVGCLHRVPDKSENPISVPYRCVRMLGRQLDAAKTCAAENGFTWRIIGKRKRK